MKSAKPTTTEGSANRRAQPVRQARQKVPRGTASHARALSGARNGLRNGQASGQNIDIFPAITSFADAVSALPRDLVRHFTLLKEVDAKIFHPEEHLHKLVDAALNTPLPEILLQQELNPQGTQPSVIDSVESQNNGQMQPSPINIEQDPMTAAIYQQWNMPRRQLFRQCTVTMSEMLVSLDEKNHVLSTANDALAKQLRRMDDLYPHIENELSDEAKYGSASHWAYLDNRTTRPNDRARRDAPVVSKESQQQTDEAAARSDARKQAMLAKKARTVQTLPEVDETVVKKPHGNTKKSRLADIVSSSGVVVDGDIPVITTAKRRKTEKAPLGGAVMERVNSAASGTAGPGKGKYGTSRDVAMSETKKKVIKPANTGLQSKKRLAVAQANSSKLLPVASPPIHGTSADVKFAAKASPLLTNGRPVGRGRQNSTQSIVTSASSASRAKASIETPPQMTTPNHEDGKLEASLGPGASGRPLSEVKASAKEEVINLNVEQPVKGAGTNSIGQHGIHASSGRKDAGARSEETIPSQDEEISSLSHLQSTNKIGRPSKTPTPLVRQLHENTSSRSRSARVVPETVLNSKRSHKKGAGVAANMGLPMNAESNEMNEANNADTGEDNEHGDADEPTYCYCNNISYGEMVACDNDACAKEWFHLECAGLDKAPVGKAKWYCNECKETMKNSKRLNGR